METFLEILKYTIPGLLVFATAYHLLKQYLDDKYNTLQLGQRLENQKITLPLRLQAYERFALLCDRIALQNVLLRIRTGGMTVRDLHASFLISIRQEFEHNASQQIFISDTLWKIISLAKDETLGLVNHSAHGLDPLADGEILVDAILKNMENQGAPSPLQKALTAIRAETSGLF